MMQKGACRVDAAVARKFGALILAATTAGCGAPGPEGDLNVAEVASALSAQDILGFESSNSWRASSGRVAVAANHTQGDTAFALSAPTGYTTLVSAPVASTAPGLVGLNAAGSTLSVDLLVPTQQPNAFYFGALQ